MGKEWNNVDEEEDVDESGRWRCQWGDTDDDIDEDDDDEEEADEVKWDVEMAVGSVGD